MTRTRVSPDAEPTRFADRLALRSELRLGLPPARSLETRPASAKVALQPTARAPFRQFGLYAVWRASGT